MVSVTGDRPEQIFQSTLPVRGATVDLTSQFESTPTEFQSTLPVRGATDSIFGLDLPTRISIHAPREGSDLTKIAGAWTGCEFQSTLPVRGATRARMPYSARL